MNRVQKQSSREKIERFLACSAWPSEVSAVRKNIFYATKLDKDIKSNSGNIFTIHEPIRDQYEGNYRLQAAMKK